MVQWLRLGVPNAAGTGSNPGCGTKLLHATQYNLKKKNFSALFKCHGRQWQLVETGTQVQHVILTTPQMGKGKGSNKYNANCWRNLNMDYISANNSV